MPSTVVRHPQSIPPSVGCLSWMSSIGPSSFTLHLSILLRCWDANLCRLYVSFHTPASRNIPPGRGTSRSQREGVESGPRVWSPGSLPAGSPQVRWLHHPAEAQLLPGSLLLTSAFLGSVTTSSFCPFRLWNGISCLRLLPQRCSLRLVGFSLNPVHSFLMTTVPGTGC